jgi:hypothetical protein
MNVFIVDEKSIKLFNYYLNNEKKELFVEILNNYNCKFFINLDSKISKNYYKLFYGLDIYVLDLSILNYYKYNKNSILQLLFLIRNLVLFVKIFNNL